MKKHIFPFSVGFAATFAALLLSFPHGADGIEIAKTIDVSNVTTATDLTELIKMILSTVGGILATVILAFLKKKFPDWFLTRK
jgi:hypothetical protein